MRLIRLDLPLMTLAIGFAVLSAAESFGQNAGSSRETDGRRQRVVASGRLTGTRDVHQIVTGQTRGNAYLAVETRGPRQRIIWQTDGGAGSRVDSVRISDLDGDGSPEILSVWSPRSSHSGELRVFHWDPRQNSFVELQSQNEINRVIDYRVVRLAGSRSSSRVVVERRSTGDAQGPRTRSVEYELRGSRLVRVGGDPIVTTQGDSGIEGQAIISPARPGPLRQGMPASAPFKTTLVVSSEDGSREIKRFETDSDGRFRVALPPGTYKVGPPPQTGRFLPRGSEETVTVEPGRFAKVTISFDSGMR